MADRLDLVQDIADASEARHRNRMIGTTASATVADEDDTGPHELDEPAPRMHPTMSVPFEEEYEEEEEQTPQEEESTAASPPPSLTVSSSVQINESCWSVGLILVSLMSCILVCVCIIGYALMLQPSLAPSSPLPRHIYPLWMTQHETRSVELSLREHAVAIPLVVSLENTFRGHFETSDHFEFLCMTHVKVPSFDVRPSYQVCGAYNRAAKQLYMMVNPTIIGQSNQTDAYLEASVACSPPAERSRARARQVFVEWIDPGLRSQMSARFVGIQAAAIQMAVEEMHQGCVSI